MKCEYELFEMVGEEEFERIYCDRPAIAHYWSNLYDRYFAVCPEDANNLAIEDEVQEYLKLNPF